jgi:hypothetical protein
MGVHGLTVVMHLAGGCCFSGHPPAPMILFAHLTHFVVLCAELRELQDGSYKASLSMPAQLTCPRLPLLPVHSQVRSGIGDTLHCRTADHERVW